MRRGLASVIAVVAACSSAPAPRPVAKPAAAKAEPRGLIEARQLFAEVDRVPDPEPFAILEDKVRAGRDDWPTAARAEGDLLLVLASARMIEARLAAVLDPDAGAHEELAATALPIAFDERRLDGELAPAYRDRLCQTKAGDHCKDVLPDYWGAALAYAAAPRLAARVGEILPGCASCAARYQTLLERVRALPDAAAAREAEARPGWTLEQDGLARSAFGLEQLEPTDVRIRAKVSKDGFIQIAGQTIASGGKPAERRKSIAAALTAAPEGAGQPKAGQRWLVEVDARAASSPRELAEIAAAALDAGFAGLALATRSAAPPHFRGFLVVEIVARAPGKKELARNPGWRTISIGKKDTMQQLVDHLDERFGSLGDGGGRVLLALDGKG